MNRFLIAIATMVFAVAAMLTPTAPAHAGMKGRLAVGLAIGALSVMAHEHRRYERHQRWKKKRYHARRKAKKKVYVSKKSSSPAETVAKAEPDPAPIPVQKEIDTLVQNENSSISTAALEPIEETASIDSDEPTAEPVNAVADVPGTEPEDGPKTAEKLDCKKFFPAVGMTLSVPCE